MSTEDHKQALPPGFRLGSYRVARVLGVGGFGVTYLCEHAGLALQVAVKEYLPNEIAVRDGTEVHPKSAGDREGFEWGLSRFLDEARTLARFEHPNVVRVRDCFEANNTAYIVMDYEDGEPLDALLQRRGTLTEAQLNRVLRPVVDGLRQVHAAGFVHRDIKPANIFVRRSDESPVLLDFGSARQALGLRSRSVTAIASAGYSPPEQYQSHGPQGPWTDIYALSALCHRAITGEAPMEATRRQSQLLRARTDPLPRLAATPAAGYSLSFLEAVDWGLRLIETERPQSLDEWLPGLERARTATTTAAAKKYIPATAAGDPTGPMSIEDQNEAQYIGFWRRVWASVVDAILISVITVPVLLLAYGEQYLLSDDLIHGPLDFVLAWVFPAIAATLFWIYKGATPGKMTISAHIVDARTGERPSPAQCVGRYIAYFVALLPLGLGIIWVAFDRRKQGWHDKLAGTLVIRRPPPPPPWKT